MDARSYVVRSISKCNCPNMRAFLRMILAGIELRAQGLVPAGLSNPQPPLANETLGAILSLEMGLASLSNRPRSSFSQYP